jgi:hypothetical protein
LGQPDDLASAALVVVNAPLLLVNLDLRAPSAHAELPLVYQGVQRYLWECRFGPVLIEVKEGRVYVNGQVVKATQARLAGGETP